MLCVCEREREERGEDLVLLIVLIYWFLFLSKTKISKEQQHQYFFTINLTVLSFIGVETASMIAQLQAHVSMLHNVIGERRNLILGKKLI